VFRTEMVAPARGLKPTDTTPVPPDLSETLEMREKLQKQLQEIMSATKLTTGRRSSACLSRLGSDSGPNSLDTRAPRASRSSSRRTLEAFRCRGDLFKQNDHTVILAINSCPSFRLILSFLCSTSHPHVEFVLNFQSSPSCSLLIILLFLFVSSPPLPLLYLMLLPVLNDWFSTLCLFISMISSLLPFLPSSTRWHILYYPPLLLSSYYGLYSCTLLCFPPG